MTLNLIYPLICTGKLAESRDFYRRHLGFEVVFESDWYLHMERRDVDREGVERAHQIAFILPDHDTLPVTHRRPTSGLVLSFEFAEVDPLHDAMRDAGAPILWSLRDEEFGQRHFMSEDPNGLLLDIIKPIPPAPEFVAKMGGTAAAN